MGYITNIDTLSALLDRLISENIKLYFFKKDGLNENIEHQEKVISKIKERLFVLFDDVYREGSTNMYRRKEPISQRISWRLLKN